jgi:hypothetical protein
MTPAFEMEVLERVVLPGIPDVILAGPVVSGSCRVGDPLCLIGGSHDRQVRCTGIELVNWGPARTDWLSIRVSDVDLDDVIAVTRASASSSGGP